MSINPQKNDTSENSPLKAGVEVDCSGTHRASNNKWFQYGARSLFVCTTIVACSFGFLAWNYRQVKKRDRLIQSPELLRLIIKTSGNQYVRKSPRQERRIPVLWHWMGARNVGGFLLDDNHFDDADFANYREMFPEAEIYRSCIERVIRRNGKLKEIHFEPCEEVASSDNRQE